MPDSWELTETEGFFHPMVYWMKEQVTLRVPKEEAERRRRKHVPRKPSCWIKGTEKTGVEKKMLMRGGYKMREMDGIKRDEKKGNNLEG